MRKRRIIPLLVARWSSPLPGPICFHAPRFVEPAETMHGARAHAAAARRTAERQNLRLEPSPSHVPRCERAISPTYAAKPGLTCTAACRFLCRTASDQARRASGRWPKGASEPPASFRGAGRPELCQSRFNSEHQPMCCKNAGLAVPARSGGAFRGGDKARTGITPRRSSGRSVGRDRRPPKTAKPTFLQHIVWRSRAAEQACAYKRFT